MKHTGQRRQQGLTLIELMVVVAVMAVIAAIAYPLYTNQVQKARRADAKVALEALAMVQERYYTVFGAYASTTQLNDPDGDGDLGDSLIRAPLAKLDRDGDGDPDNYAINFASGGQSFTVTATAQGAQAGDTDCASFTINQAGAKTASDDKCW